MRAIGLGFGAVAIVFAAAITGGARSAQAATPVAQLEPRSESIGAGVGANPIALDRPASPGGSYRLPGLYVVNTGTGAGTFRVAIKRLSPGSEHEVPASWVALDSTEFGLAGYQSATIPLHLNVPADAQPGDYMTNLLAGTIGAGASGGGATFGAAAATKLTFSVAAQSKGPLTAPTRLLVGVGLLALVAVLAIAVKRSGVRLEIRR